MDAKGEAQIDKREAWERQHRETNAAWAGFQIYRDMAPADRTLLGAYRVAKGGEKAHVCGTWGGWFEKWHWKERAEAYDLYVDEKARLELERQRIEARKETAELGKMFRSKVKEALTIFSGVQAVRAEDGEDGGVEPSLSPYQMARLATVGVSLERLALGEPQSTADITSGGKVIVFSLPDNDRADRGGDE